MSLCSSVGKLRLKKQLTQEASADQSGISDQRSVSDLERGVANPTLETIVAAATALDVTVAELFSTEGAPTEILSPPTRAAPQA